MQFYFYVSNLLKALFFLTYRMKPHSTAWHIRLWQTSSASPISLWDLRLPGFPSSCSSQTHQPVSRSMPLHLPFSLPGKCIYPSGLQKFLLTFKFHLKYPCSWKPWPGLPLLMSSMSFITLNWNCFFIYLDWSSLGVGLVLFTPHPSSPAQPGLDEHLGNICSMD